VVERTRKLSRFVDTIVYSRMPGQKCQMCGSYQKKDSGVAFYRFPRDPVLRRSWLEVFQLQETVTVLSQEKVTVLSHRIGYFNSLTKEAPSQSCNSELVKWFWQLSFR